MTTIPLRPNPGLNPRDIDWIHASNAIKNESYFQLVWRRFVRSRVSIIGSLIVAMLAILSLFAEFFSPNQLDRDFLKDAFIPPNQIRFVDSEGKLQRSTVRLRCRHHT